MRLYYGTRCISYAKSSRNFCRVGRQYHPIRFVAGLELSLNPSACHVQKDDGQRLGRDLCSVTVLARQLENQVSFVQRPKELQAFHPKL